MDVPLRLSTQIGTKIFIYYADESEGIIFCFSGHHIHFDYSDDEEENIDELIKCIKEFIDGKKIVYEFISGGKPIFGGSVCQDSNEVPSYKTLLKNTTGRFEYILNIMRERAENGVCRSAFRSWDGTRNEDIDFSLEDI